MSDDDTKILDAAAEDRMRLVNQIDDLKFEITRLREVLESIYRWTVTSEDPEHICGWVEVEAREALAQDKESNENSNN